MENTLANVDLGRYRRIVQMFWDPEPTNDTAADQPVWCLGCSYRLVDGKSTRNDTGGNRLESTDDQQQDTIPSPLPTSTDGPQSASLGTQSESTPSSFSSALAYGETAQDGTWPQGFVDDFEARFWMTYRSDFQTIPRSTDPKAPSSMSLSMRIKSQLGDQTGFSSDSGWGCMIRSGQSLLANALALQRFGRDWRRGSQPLEERRLISLFADDPRAPYSIHNFVHHGAEACEKYPGEWFGPSATARCIQALANKNESDLKVYVTSNGHDVYEDSFMEVAKSDGEKFTPTLVLVGTRLGIDKVTPVYWEALIAALQMPQSIGIAGGRPSSAHYFAGSQGSFLFYLDPHHTRKALPYHENPAEYADEDVDSCHTTRLRRVHVREMDPSMLIGFLIRSEDDWHNWRRCVNHVQGKAIIQVGNHVPDSQGSVEPEGRHGAIDEVEAWSDEDDEGLAVSG